MKKIFCSLVTIVCIVGCTPSGETATQNLGTTPSTAKIDKVLSPEQEVEQHIYDLRKAFEKRGSNKDSLRKVYDDYLKEMSIKYQGDTLGLMLVKSMAEDYNSRQLDSVMNICDLYRNDEKLQRLAKTSLAAENTAVGKRYIDFAGRHPRSEKMFKLSSILAKGKPVLVNFWSSSNISSRHLVRDKIFDIAHLYRDKVNVLSVAVMEDSVTFVNRAISEMEIDWDVMYCEGYDNMPTEQYGIIGVPYVLLIGTDGIIKGRNLQNDEIKSAIEKELK